MLKGWRPNRMSVSNSLILLNGDRLRVLSMFAFPFMTKDLVDGNDGGLVKVSGLFEMLFSIGESKLQNELEVILKRVMLMVKVYLSLYLLGFLHSEFPVFLLRLHILGKNWYIHYNKH